MVSVPALARLTRRRVAPRSVVLAAAMALITAGLACVAVRQPAVAAVAVVVPFLPLYLRYLPLVGLALLTSAPLLFSSFQVGPLTLDNWVTLLGIGSALIWAVQQRVLRLPIAAALPLLLAAAIGVSGAIGGVDSIAGVIRYVGLALVPTLVVAGVTRRVVAERIMFGALLVGALSVLTQPVFPIVAAYVDPQTGATRFGGLMGHPNFAAYALGLGILYLIGARRLSGAAWLLVAVFGAAILLTGSVGALGTVALGLAVIVVSRGVGRALGVLMAGAIGLVALGQTLAGRIGALVSGDPNLNSLNWRFEQWRSAIALLGNQLWTGIGWQQIPLRIDSGLEAHSAYVEIYVELGIIGTVLLGFGVVALLIWAGPRLVALVMVGVVLVSSITDPVLVYPSSMATLLTLLACERMRHAETVAERQVAAPPSLQTAPQRLPAAPSAGHLVSS